ncbi:MAG: MATE family efflux transporter, partial [Muribaculaceae bacterium]|nr:MATE family efflux transporter [Muribaculaceae bacterium]
LVARVVCAVAIIAVFAATRRGTPYRGGFTSGAREPGQARLIAATGFPVAMQMAFETASFSGSAVMSGWLGAVPLAAFQIVAISGMLGFCIYYSVGAAMAIPVSHAAGRGDKQAMRRCAAAGYRIILAAMVVVSILFISFGRHIMGAFSNDPAVIGLATTLIIPMVLYQFGDATQITFANALRGTSKVMPMLYIAFVSYIVVGLPLAYIFAFPLRLGLYGIVLSFSVCLLLAGALYYIFFRRAVR